MIKTEEKIRETSDDPILISVERCDLCGSCVGICPPDCIVLTEHSLMIIGPECIRCGLCLSACPVGALVWNDEEVEVGLHSKAGDNGE